MRRSSGDQPTRSREIDYGIHRAQTLRENLDKPNALPVPALRTAQYRQLMTLCQQRLTQRGTDQARTSRDQNMHLASQHGPNGDPRYSTNVYAS